jgi:putative peptidoglycan lipid II flippase
MTRTCHPAGSSPSIDRRSVGFIRRVFTVSALTAVSRVLGLARDVACAAAFGAGASMDAFLFAFRLPNLLRKLLGEGALAVAFIPLLTERMERDGPDAARRMASRIATAAALLLLVLVVAAELLVLALWPRLGHDPRWRLVLIFSAILLPYMLLICMTGVAGAVLHSLHRFTAPALAPIVLNVCWLAAIGLAAWRFGGDVTLQLTIVCCGILAAGLLQLAVQLIALRRAEFPLRPVRRALHADVRRVARSMAPIVFGLAVLQINVLLDGVIAIGLAARDGQSSFQLFGASIRYPLEAGANVVLFYGNRLMQLPLGVFGIALATVSFPVFSRRAAQGDLGGLARAVTDGLRLTLFIGVPAGVGLAVLRRPLIDLIYSYGAFDASAAARTANVLLAYSVALWAYCANHLLTRAFYSLQRNGTPARVASAMVALNLALNLTLIWYLREAGLAAATAVCAILQMLILFLLLRRHTPALAARPLLDCGLRCIIAAAVMAAVCLGTVSLLPSQESAPGLMGRVLRAGLPVATGAAVYAALTAAMHMPEMQMLRSALRKRAAKI